MIPFALRSDLALVLSMELDLLNVIQKLLNLSHVLEFMDIARQTLRALSTTHNLTKENI